MKLKKYTISVYSENNVGLLNRISAIFLKRHVNIESLTTSQSEIDNSTSGDETFLLNEIDENILSRCNGFFVDLPPHNQSYFQSQHRRFAQGE